MNVLIIGAGGREHALAWKAARSPRLTKLFIAPGNPGSMSCGENVPLDVSDHPAVISFCTGRKIDLVIVGPEIPLAAGLVDSLSAAGIPSFGPTRSAAQIEASKVFSKNFMACHHIPTARFAAFTQLADALDHLRSIDYPVVIKASGLAAGKGVILPGTFAEAQSALESILIDRAFGDAGCEVVIEERLSGEEVSLMAFTDGRSVKPMLPAQDHKRLLDGDEGPNTGGMGAYAPAPVFTAEMMNEALTTILQPAVDGMRLEGTPFVGVLYAGLMLTEKGLSVLEFNCRFGDPETQAVLPLLESDLLDIAEACINGTLADVDIRWNSGAAVCVVLAGRGYPEQAESGREVEVSALPGDMLCFHAGTKFDQGRVVTSGGRVLGLTARAPELASAIKMVYTNIHCAAFDGMNFRRDIGRRALKGEK